MSRTQEFLTTYWFSLALLAIALALGTLALARQLRRGTWPLTLILIAPALACFAIGGLIMPESLSFWLGASVLVVYFGMFLVLFTNGGWYAPAGYALAALLCLCTGGLAALPVGEAFKEAAKVCISLEPTQPFWLVLLLFIPVVIWLSYRSLAGLGPVRRWVAIGLRCLLILLLTLAMAEVRIRHQNENLSVFFLVDRSLSIPEEFDQQDTDSAIRRDERWNRVESFLNSTVQFRGAEHKDDRAGLILFGRRPHLEFPASKAPAFNFRLKDSASNVDRNYTDIAAALKLAMASFPEGTGKRIVLISDGNENLGNAEEQARIAKTNGIQIDVVPLAAGFKNENEVLVQAVEAPGRTEQGARLPIRVLLRSQYPRQVYGTLFLNQIANGISEKVPGSPMKVVLKPGLNAIPFRQPLADTAKSYTYQAIFQPEASQGVDGKLVKGLAGDRVQNNSATTHVVALGQRRILLVEPKVGDHKLLVDRLRAVGNNKYRVDAISVDSLPQAKAELAVFLSNYDCVILANVAASDVQEGNVGGGDRQAGVITDEQQEIIRSNTHEQGCGLIMIGGPNSFGAGGWQGTPVEKALPVDCDIKSFKVQGKSGLALIMHASEMADGNRWQKEIAKLAIKKLQPTDEVGVLHWDFGGHKWHIPLQEIRTKRAALLGLVDRLTPGDMPDFDGALRMSLESLSEEKRQIATKHVIIISDGDPQVANPGTLTKMKEQKITVTTVGVATHGASQDASLKSIADKTGGRFYKVLNARALPSIYVKETRLISQSVLFEKRFQPNLLFKSGPTEKLDGLPPLHGYVRTTAKPSALVQVPIMAPKQGEQEFPILAFWHYGLGKSVAFTSDARSLPGRPYWDQEWASSDIYAKFWEQVVDWSLRATESGRFALTPEYSDGKVKVILDARDSENKPLQDLKLRAGVTLPTARPEDTRQFRLEFKQKTPGVYEAQFPAEEAGSYFINVEAVREVEVVKKEKQGDKEVEVRTRVEEGMDSVRAGVTVPYSPEFADLESNTALMERVRDLTGGKTLAEERLSVAMTDDAEKTSLAQEIFRSGLPQFKNLQPVWFWLVFWTSILLFFDVAVRRIALEPAVAFAAGQRVWQRLRGQAQAAPQTAAFMDRLQTRKAKVSETLEQLRAAKRFEQTEARTVDSSAMADVAATTSHKPIAPRPVAPAPGIAPKKEEDAADFASRLMKAKKRVWEERQTDQ